MCKVKSGVAIQSRQDVQNLVIGIINRQEKGYRKEEILNLVEYYMKGSRVTISKMYLEDIISKNLDMLYRNNCVRCKNGYYIPQINFLNFTR